MSIESTITKLCRSDQGILKQITSRNIKLDALLTHHPKQIYYEVQGRSEVYLTNCWWSNHLLALSLV